MHQLAGYKKLKDEYKDPDVLPKVNKADMAGTMESIKEYLRSYCGIIRATLAYIIRKTITVQTYGDYPTYATPDDEIIARILHQPPDKGRLHDEQSAPSVKGHTAEYNIENRSVYIILGQICKDTDLYPCFKQHKSKRKAEVFFCNPFQVVRPKPCQCNSIRNDCFTDVMYDGDKKAWNWEMYVA